MMKESIKKWSRYVAKLAPFPPSQSPNSSPMMTVIVTVIIVLALGSAVD